MNGMGFPSKISLKNGSMTNSSTRGLSMQKQLLIVFPFLMLLYGCDSFLGSERKLKPYDPQKAGATIINRFNITDKIKITGRPKLPGGMISSSYDVAEYNNALYINNDGFIYIFDKNTFDKIEEIKLISPGGAYLWVHGDGLAITEDGHAFLLDGNSSMSLLYSINLSTGATILFDDFTSDKFDFGDVYIDQMGYNKTNDTIWFGIWQDSKLYYLFYKYDANEERFIFLEQKDGFVRGYDASIYGNICWLSDFSFPDPSNRMVDIGIFKYSFENPAERLHFIDVEYLNTLTIPRSAHYDGEHIWLMVERNDQIQMLKLLPHG
jgi:hypothetical protein